MTTRHRNVALAGALLLATAVASQAAFAAPTCNTRLQAAWTPGTSFPATLVRPWATYFPATGKLYVLGGRSADGAGNDLLHPAELDPHTGVWTTKPSTFADNQVNNMVGGILDFSGTPAIVLVGGSAAGATTATAAVRQYNPVTDTLTTLATDPWPGVGAGNVLPGGAAVYGNKLYVFGGFQINVGMISSIWVFDPAAAAGSRWTQMTATLPTALGYIPAATSGSHIYLIGGSTYDGAALIDSSSALAYDPNADSIAAIATPPRAVAETRALAQADGSVWVLSGGRIAPNPTSQVDVYLPSTNTWTSGPAPPTARQTSPPTATRPPAACGPWAATWRAHRRT